ncbi:MAG: hypothetical protein U1E65_32110 [Myxococcota bacterium]
MKKIEFRPPTIDGTAIREAAELAKKVSDLPARGREQAEEVLDAFERDAPLVLGVVKEAIADLTNPAAYGRSLSVDEWQVRPRGFGYGSSGQTLVEGEARHRWLDGDRTVDTLARGRVFSSPDDVNGHHMLGAEGEIGILEVNTEDGPGRHVTDAAFLGHQVRVYGEGAKGGASAGFEAFGGIRLFRDEHSTKEDGTRVHNQQQVDLGASSFAVAQAGVLYAHAAVGTAVGARYRGENEERKELLPGLDGFHREAAEVFLGVEARAAAKVSPAGASAGVDAFAGIKAELTETVGVNVGGVDVGLMGGVEGWAGVGLVADVSLGPTGFDYAFGAGVLVGVGVRGGVEVDGLELSKTERAGGADASGGTEPPKV